MKNNQNLSYPGFSPGNSPGSSKEEEQIYEKLASSLDESEKKAITSAAQKGVITVALGTANALGPQPITALLTTAAAMVKEVKESYDGDIKNIEKDKEIKDIKDKIRSIEKEFIEIKKK